MVKNFVTKALLPSAKSTTKILKILNEFLSRKGAETLLQILDDFPHFLTIIMHHQN